MAVLDPPLCVADVQVYRILCVQVGHDVQPPAEEGVMFSSSETAHELTWQSLSLLFTVDGWVFPAGLTDKDPVLHLISGERTPSKNNNHQVINTSADSLIHPTTNMKVCHHVFFFCLLDFGVLEAKLTQCCLLPVVADS